MPAPFRKFALIFVTIGALFGALAIAKTEFQGQPGGGLKVGAAMRILTPDPLLPVSGGMGAPKPVKDKRGEITVRAMVLQKGDTTVALVGIDLLGFPSVLGNRVRSKVPRIQGTIPHPITGEAAAGVVMLRPAAPGTGVIAGGPVRAVLECAGIHDVLSKSLGSDNAINVVHATVAALKLLERPEAVAARRGLPLEDVAPAALLRARAAGGS